MGLAKLNVWVSDTDDPCSVSNRIWFVTIYGCDGRVLRWCRRRYFVIPAPCGHVEVELPPGCYRVSAVWGFRPIPGGLWGNHFTDSAIVQVRCGETACVRLFNPSLHRCGRIFLQAIENLQRQNVVGKDVAQPVADAINRLLELAPRPARAFELDLFDEIDKGIARQKKELKEDEEQAEDP